MDGVCALDRAWLRRARAPGLRRKPGKRRPPTSCAHALSDPEGGCRPLRRAISAWAVIARFPASQQSCRALPPCFFFESTHAPNPNIFATAVPLSKKPLTGNLFCDRLPESVEKVFHPIFFEPVLKDLEVLSLVPRKRISRTVLA